MFTGLVQAIGTVVSVNAGRFAISCPWPQAKLALGASIACDGCCLSVTSIHTTAGGCIFTVDVSHETLGKTTLGEWSPGRAINLEPSLRAGDELGGHLVSGHIDAVATIESVASDGFSKVFRIRPPEGLVRFAAPKGSVALDGISLTVNQADAATFTVNLIPITQEATTWGHRRVGDRVNMEVDLIARYVARLLQR